MTKGRIKKRKRIIREADGINLQTLVGKQNQNGWSEVGKLVTGNLRIKNHLHRDTYYTIRRILMEMVPKLKIKEVTLKVLERALADSKQDAYTKSALEELGFIKKAIKRKITVKDYNPSPVLLRTVKKFIKDPFAAAIVATWYDNEDADPSDVSEGDVEDLLVAASDPQEIKIVKAAL